MLRSVSGSLRVAAKHAARTTTRRWSRSLDERIAGARFLDGVLVSSLKSRGRSCSRSSRGSRLTCTASSCSWGVRLSLARRLPLHGEGYPQVASSPDQSCRNDRWAIALRCRVQARMRAEEALVTAPRGTRSRLTRLAPARAGRPPERPLRRLILATEFRILVCLLRNPSLGRSCHGRLI
jgi:hypothetical protein